MGLPDLTDHQPSKVSHGLVLDCTDLQQGTQILWDSVFSSSESRKSLNFKSQWKLQTFSSISFPHERKAQEGDPDPLVRCKDNIQTLFLHASKTLEKFLYKYRNSDLILSFQAFATDSHSYLTVWSVLVSIMWALARCTRSLPTWPYARWRAILCYITGHCSQSLVFWLPWFFSFTVSWFCFSSEKHFYSFALLSQKVV